MLDAVLRRYKVSVRISVKGAVSVLLIVLAVALPQFGHFFGKEFSATYMPMYAPALLAGCLLGYGWGLGVGILSPVISFGFSSLFLSSVMPTASRLPYMILELALYGLICGLFAKKIEKNAFVAFPVVALAQVSGRAVYVIYNLIAGRSFLELWASVQTGLLGLYIQLILVPLIVIVLAKLIRKDHAEGYSEG